MRQTAAVLAAAGGAAGHGGMTYPPPRNAYVKWHPTPKTPFDSDGAAGDLSCQNGMCMWFSDGCTIGCANCSYSKDFFGSHCGKDHEWTMTDPAERTMNPNSPAGSAADQYRHHPWRAPGASPVYDPCGMSGGAPYDNTDPTHNGLPAPGTKAGDLGSLLAPVKPTVWTAGSTAKVAWSISANHAGGYQYRLCPKSQPLTETCFQDMPLAYADDKVTLRFGNGTEVDVPAVRVTEGVVPSGSVWTKNPIPACNDPYNGFHGCHTAESKGPQFAPPPGCDETCWGYTSSAPGSYSPPGGKPIYSPNMPHIVDRVVVPDTPGEYVIGFRWDCEHTAQVWQSCGDITIV